MLKIWFISVDENIFVYFLQQFVKITLNGIVVIMPGSKIQALKTFVIPISMSSSINRRKMLTLPFWRAKQKVTTFQTSPLCSACRNIPLLWKRYVSINKRQENAVTSCLESETGCRNFGLHHCVWHPEKPPSCENGTDQSINGRKSCHFLFGERNRKWQHFGLHHCIRHPEKPPSYENDTKQSMKCCHFLFGERKGCWILGHHHCVQYPEKPPSCENGTNQSINGSKMLSLPVWRAKQEETIFWASPLYSASRETPFLWKRHGSINEMLPLPVWWAIRVSKFWTSPLCLASRKTPILWKRHGSDNKRQ